MHDSSTATLNDVDYHQVEEKSGQIGVLKLNNHQVDYLQLDNYQLDYHRRDYHKEDYHQQKKKCQVTSGSTVGKWFVINSCNKFLISSVGLASLHIFVFYHWPSSHLHYWWRKSSPSFIFKILNRGISNLVSGLIEGPSWRQIWIRSFTLRFKEKQF